MAEDKSQVQISMNAMKVVFSAAITLINCLEYQRVRICPGTRIALHLCANETRLVDP